MATRIAAAMTSRLRAAIIVVSETASKDPSTDKCIPALRDVFQQDGADRWDATETKIVADDVSAIQKAITAYTDGSDSANLVVTSGGTGFAQKDVTPEVSSRCNESTACRTINWIDSLVGSHASYPQARTWTGPWNACGIASSNALRRHVSSCCWHSQQHTDPHIARLSQRRQGESTVGHQASASCMPASCRNGLPHSAFWWHPKAREGCRCQCCIWSSRCSSRTPPPPSP